MNNLNRVASSGSFQGVLRGPILIPNPAKRPLVAQRNLGASQTAPEAASRQHRAHARRDAEADPDLGQGAGQGALLDPLWCQMAMHPAALPNLAAPAALAPPATLPLREDLQNLLSGLARRVAWGGDRRKGSARIELSEGALAGATLIVHTEQRAVSVEIELPSGAGGALGLEQRIQERLEQRGFAARVRIA